MSDRRPPVLRNAIAILALTTGMLVAAPTALMTSAGAASTRPTINSPSSGKPSHPKPNESKSYTVTFAATMDLPKGTTMTSKFVDREDSSKCLRATWDSGFNTEPGRAGPFSECAYLKSFGTFKLNVVLPNKQSLWTEVRLQQTNSPNIYFTTFEGQCSSVGNLKFRGALIRSPLLVITLSRSPSPSVRCQAVHMARNSVRPNTKSVVSIGASTTSPMVPMAYTSTWTLHSQAQSRVSRVPSDVTLSPECGKPAS